MKLLQLDSNSYDFPQGIESAREFAEFANENGLKFVKLNKYVEDHCTEPYFIEEDKKEVWVNLSQIAYIEEGEGNVMKRVEYERRLREVIGKKCVDCIYFEGDFDNLDLDGHYGNLSLDGNCFTYRKRG